MMSSVPWCIGEVDFRWFALLEEDKCADKEGVAFVKMLTQN